MSDVSTGSRNKSRAVWCGYYRFRFALHYGSTLARAKHDREKRAANKRALFCSAAVIAARRLYKGVAKVKNHGTAACACAVYIRGARGAPSQV